MRIETMDTTSDRRCDLAHQVAGDGSAWHIAIGQVQIQVTTGRTTHAHADDFVRPKNSSDNVLAGFRINGRQQGFGGFPQDLFTFSSSHDAALPIHRIHREEIVSPRWSAYPGLRQIDLASGRLP